MKFAQVLLFACVISMTLSLERTVSKAETEYLAATKAAKVEVGYKELGMDQSPIQAALVTNHEVDITLDGKGQALSLQMNMGFTKNMNQFPMGLSFYTKGALAGPAAANFVVHDNKMAYIPYVIFTEIINTSNRGDRKAVPTLSIMVQGKSGASRMVIAFKNIPRDSATNYVMTAIMRQIQSNYRKRKQDISDSMANINEYLWEASEKQAKIKEVTQQDAEVKKTREAAIAKTQAEIATLEKQKAALEAQSKTLSGELQSVRSNYEKANSAKTKKNIEKAAIEKTIATLKSLIKKEETINALKKEVAQSKIDLKYWLQGSVYHRVCNEKESNELFNLALNDAKFDSDLNGFFFPQ